MSKNESRLVLLLNPKTREELERAAEYDDVPISIWARAELLKVARATAHRKLCATVKKEQPMWCGKPVTQEEYEQHLIDSEATNPKRIGI